jgi:hypothetical protein
LVLSVPLTLARSILRESCVFAQTHAPLLAAWFRCAASSLRLCPKQTCPSESLAQDTPLPVLSCSPERDRDPPAGTHDPERRSGTQFPRETPAERTPNAVGTRASEGCLGSGERNTNTAGRDPERSDRERERVGNAVGEQPRAGRKGRSVPSSKQQGCPECPAVSPPTPLPPGATTTAESEGSPLRTKPLGPSPGRLWASRPRLDGFAVEPASTVCKAINYR